MLSAEKLTGKGAIDPDWGSYRRRRYNKGRSVVTPYASKEQRRNGAGTKGRRGGSVPRAAEGQSIIYRHEKGIICKRKNVAPCKAKEGTACDVLWDWEEL